MVYNLNYLKKKMFCIYNVKCVFVIVIWLTKDETTELDMSLISDMVRIFWSGILEHGTCTSLLV